jgi:hypothetical protein
MKPEASEAVCMLPRLVQLLLRLSRHPCVLSSSWTCCISSRPKDKALDVTGRMWSDADGRTLTRLPYLFTAVSHRIMAYMLYRAMGLQVV